MTFAVAVKAYVGMIVGRSIHLVIMSLPGAFFGIIPNALYPHPEVFTIGVTFGVLWSVSHFLDTIVRVTPRRSS